MAYRPEVWRDLFIVVGGAAASLVGLLFVVMSLHFNAFQSRLDYNLRATVHAARNNTYHLLTVMLTALAILAPQKPQMVGLELIGLHLFGLRLPLLFTYTHFIRNHGGFPMAMIVTISAGYLLGAAAGAALIWRPEWGLALAAVACAVLMVRTVLTAWMLMFEREHGEA